MDIFSLNKLMLFIVTFIPGFISLKIYDLLVANEPRDFSKSLLEVIGYSAFNFALMSWLILIIFKLNLFLSHTFIFWLSTFLVLFLCPIIWPILFINAYKWGWLARHIIHPVKRPWDWVFSQKKPTWVIVTLTDGRKIGGIFFDKSYASSYPLPEQIFLEQVWKLDDQSRFKEAVSGSKGVIILGRDMSFIEFFTNETPDD